MSEVLVARVSLADGGISLQVGAPGTIGSQLELPGSYVRPEPVRLRVSAAVRDLERLEAVVRRHGTTVRAFIDSGVDIFDGQTLCSAQCRDLMIRFHRMFGPSCPNRFSAMLSTGHPENMLQYTKRYGWPKHLWAGVTVSSQHDADTRIPVLAQMGAAVRWICAERLVGEIDLSTWIKPLHPALVYGQPETWNRWNGEGLWPSWVPARWKRHLEAYWSGGGVGPRDYLAECLARRSPPIGQRLKASCPSRPGVAVTGRWVYAWGGMGVLVATNGTVCRSHTGTELIRLPVGRRWQPVDWVVLRAPPRKSSTRGVAEAIARVTRLCAAADIPVHSLKPTSSVDEQSPARPNPCIRPNESGSGYGDTSTTAVGREGQMRLPREGIVPSGANQADSPNSSPLGCWPHVVGASHIW